MKKQRHMNLKGRRKDIVASTEWEAIPEEDKWKPQGVGFVDTDSKVFASSDPLAKALAKAQQDATSRFNR